MERQTTLIEYEQDQDGDGDGWSPEYDDYGPTMARPIPEAERGAAWKRALRERGFSPDCLLESLSHGGLSDYHIDDEERPERVDLWREQVRKVHRPKS